MALREAGDSQKHTSFPESQEVTSINDLTELHKFCTETNGPGNLDLASNTLLRRLGHVPRVAGQFGMVRTLFFDKPPGRTWNLAWHKDTSIAVKDNSITSPYFSRPTTKAGIPHVIASDNILKQMLTLRIHPDEVTDENGPLRVIPGSHTSSQSEGVGVENASTQIPRLASV